MAADPTIFSAVARGLRELGVRYRVGRVWTTDAPALETRERVAAFRAKGCSCVDMETSAIYAVAERVGVRACALHVVSDLVLESGWQIGFLEGRFQRIKRAFCTILAKLALKVLSSL